MSETPIKPVVIFLDDTDPVAKSADPDSRSVEAATIASEPANPEPPEAESVASSEPIRIVIIGIGEDARAVLPKTEACEAPPAGTVSPIMPVVIPLPDSPEAPGPSPDQAAEPRARKPSPGGGGLAGGALALLLVGLMVLSLVEFVLDAFGRTTWLGVASLVLILAVFGALVVAVRREWQAVRRLSDIATVRAELGNPDLPVARLEDLLRSWMRRAGLDQNSFRPVLFGTGGREDRQKLIDDFDCQILTPINKNAQLLVRNAANRATAAIALSPFRWLDLVIYGFAVIDLACAIAALYGARPTRLAGWLLVRQAVVGGLAEVGVDELVKTAATRFGDATGVVGQALGSVAGAYVAHGRIMKIGKMITDNCQPFSLPQAPPPPRG